MGGCLGMGTGPGSSVPFSLSRPAPALGEPGPSPLPGPQLHSVTGGLPTASTPGPKAAGPWRPGCRGAPRGQSKAVASARCKERLHSLLPWLLRPGQAGKRQPLPSGRRTVTGQGGGSKRGGLCSQGAQGRPPQQGGGEQRCAQHKGLPCQQPCRQHPPTEVEGGGLEREAGPLGPRAGLSCAHPVLHAGGLGGPPASVCHIPRPQGRAGGSGVSHQGRDLITEG